MPRGNGTGPMGMGRMSGRGAEYCAGYAFAGYENSAGFARRFGCGIGHGRGYGRVFCANGKRGMARCAYPGYLVSLESMFDEKSFLSKQAAILEQQLEQVKKRISDLNDNAD